MLPGCKSPPLPGFWIPACAGMTVGGGVCVAVGWLAQYDSPSPNPLPLGEGFPLGGKPLYARLSNSQLIIRN